MPIPEAKRRESVVYVLGAGFSQPLGLPLMSDFIQRSKDLYFENPAKYSSFRNIFKLLERIAVAQASFRVDLHNIEEVLSILEMQSALRVTRKDRAQFIEYLLTVIESLTPAAGRPNLNLRHMNLDLFGNHPTYPLFVASLLGLTFNYDRQSGKRAVQSSKQWTDYAVITLNYDTVLEDAQGVLDQISSESLPRLVCLTKKPPSHPSVPLVKLHGGVTERSVIAPTWNKVLDEDIKPRWKAALDILATANHVRVIGYSLPPADAYIRFLFKAAALRSLQLQATSHLKSFHVICLDNEQGGTAARYRDFVEAPGFRFFSTRTEDYLGPLAERARLADYQLSCTNALEVLHNEFVTKF